MQDPEAPLYKAEPTCANGDKPMFGKCEGMCPAGCAEGHKGDCVLACPAGTIPCARKMGDSFCAKVGTYGAAAYAGYDACAVVESMEHHLDEKCVCDYPVLAPAAPAKNATVVVVATKPATKPAVVVVASPAYKPVASPAYKPVASPAYKPATAYKH